MIYGGSGEAEIATAKGSIPLPAPITRVTIGQDMTTSLKKISQAIGEWDYAMRSSSHGAQGNRDVLLHAIRNLPSPELDKLRPLVETVIKEAVARTQTALLELGITLDEPHPLRVKASIDDPGSYFYKADRK